MPHVHRQNNLTKTTNQQALVAKRMLSLEVVICVISVIVFFALVIFAAVTSMADWQRATLIIIGVTQVVAVMFCALRIEQIIGFYHCAKCGNDYVPTYGRVLWAPHFCRIRYLKCPKCGQRSWQKKKLTKA